MTTVPEALLRRVAALSPRRKKLLATRFEAHARESLAFRSVSTVEGVPLSVGQQRMWEQLEQHPQLPINVVCQVVGLRGELDPERLRAAVEAFAARHRVLDTRVTRSGTTTLQFPSSTPRLTWRTHQLLGEGDPVAALDALARAQAYETGNGQTAPLAIFTLVSASARFHAWVITAQNLVIDAISFSILLEEVGQAYVSGKLAPQPRYQMVDAADWEQRWVRSAEYRRRLDYWTKLLGELELATRQSPERPARVQRFVGERIEFDIAQGTRTRLAALCRENQTTAFVGMATVVLLFCARQAEGRDALIGTLATGRVRPELERIVGCLFQILLLHARPRPEQTFADLLRQVRGHVLAAQQHDGVSYEALVDLLPQDTASPQRPIFDLLFIYENIPEPSEHFGELALTTRDVDKGCARFPLSLAIYDAPERMHGWLEYDAGVHTRPQVEAMIERFRSLLESVVHEPARKLAP